ncbi:MAG TPA: ATP-dependent DNA ligase [Nocardioidaceae bacterium]|nr:ATP-dependent DNA ligase [Nocardioidaceae bacterium]
MLLAELVTTSQAVAATGSRLAKREALAALLRRCPPGDVEIAVTYLAGDLRQRRTGVGWAGLRGLPAPAESPTLTLATVDAAFERASRLFGEGSATARAAVVADLFGRATAHEQAFLRGLVSGDVRQGALDAAMLDAVAAAAVVPLPDVRRAAMLCGSTADVAVAALTGGTEAVRALGLVVGRPIRPMLASSAPDVAAAFAKAAGDALVLDAKLDGIRIQVHRDGEQVAVFTRSLDDITGRLPEVADVVRALPVRSAVLDGEAMTLDGSGRPRPFQDTASRTARQHTATPPPDPAPTAEATATPIGDLSSPAEVPAEPALAAPVPGTVTPFFFDVLHLDGEDLIDRPLRERLARLDAVVPPPYRVARVPDVGVEEGRRFFADMVAAGQEGVVVKSLSAPYEAGRRGAAWVKVKPRHTLDLVVLAVEWGSGRRQGWLSNIHLGARDPASGGFVMLGKTFKGMTDEMLAWQTDRFLGLEVSRTSYVVTVRPEQVVEIAFDGLQRSTRYPGGVALRFARVVRYRDDKTAAEADTLDTVRALL